MSILIQKAACGFMAVALLFTLAFSFSNPAHAQSTSAQQEQIQALLLMIQQLQAQLAQLQGGGNSGTQCAQLSRSLFQGASDKDSAGEVSKLQRFLSSTGHYTYGEVTGYFGPATQRAVQAWQASKGVVSSGSPETTGYGVVGSRTRAVMSRSCRVVTVTPPPIPDTGDVVYDLEITHPQHYTKIYTGDTVRLRWDEMNLERERGIVTLESGNFTIDLAKHVDIGDEGVTVTLPDYKSLGIVSEKNYDLKLWVTGVKDGGAKSVADTVRIKVVPRFASTDKAEKISSNVAHEEMIKNLLKQIEVMNPGSSSDDLLEDSKDFLEEADSHNKDDHQEQINKLLEEISRLNDASKNEYDLYITSPVSGKTAITPGQTITVQWSQENLGNDIANITLQGPTDGGAETQRHIATRVPLSLGKKSIKIPISDSLGTVTPGTYDLSIWVTNIKDGSEKSLRDSIEIKVEEVETDVLMGSMAVGVGAYEGSYPSGERHSFGYHPQGEIDVYLSENPNYKGSLTLVLSSYEPVKWNISGPGIGSIGEVLATGYYDQEVSGLDVPVTMLSHESGSQEYFYSYENSGSEFDELHDFVKNKYQTKFQMYDGAYTQNEVVFDAWKG